MKISKSKHQLAQLLIEAGVKQFPDGANWVAHDGNGAGFYSGGKPYWDSNHHEWASNAENGSCVGVHTLNGCIKNHHQTVLSRAEFDQIVAESAEQGPPDADGWVEWKGGDCPVDGDLDVSVKCCGEDSIGTGKAKSWSWGHCGDGADIIAYRLHKPEQAEPQYCESVTRAIPESVTAPTLDQLLQDYRNASDFAAAKQAEADEAAKMRDEQWKAAQARACELGVHISFELVVDAEMSESEPVITDWRDLRKGDVIWWSGHQGFKSGEYKVCDLENREHEGPCTILIYVGCHKVWVNCDLEEWRFIRRP